MFLPLILYGCLEDVRNTCTHDTEIKAGLDYEYSQDFVFNKSTKNEYNSLLPTVFLA